MKRLVAAWLLFLVVVAPAAAQTEEIHHRGEAIELGKAIPTNERGILCLAQDGKGQIVGGTTGRAAHLFLYNPASGNVRSLARLDGGVGFAYALVRLPDGSFIGGTQADPTGTAVKTDPAAVGHLYRFQIGDGQAKVEDLGFPVRGQGVYTLAYLEASNEVVGNTWPDGHFFSYDIKTKAFKDHGAIAGYHTYETPHYAADINRGTDQKISYPRQVSRAIVVVPGSGVYTAGADGVLFRYDAAAKKLDKLPLRLPAAAGRESWADLDAAVVHARVQVASAYSSIVGGTSDGYLFELRLYGKDKWQLRPRGKPFASGTVQGLVQAPRLSKGNGLEQGHAFFGVAGGSSQVPRWFEFRHGGSTSAVLPGGIPAVDGQISMVGFGAMLADPRGFIYAGERDRIGRLVRFALAPGKPKVNSPAVAKPQAAEPVFDNPPRLDCNVVFAPQGTTTDGSGYTAIEVGKDGLVYVGSARYGDYAWLLRFDPAKKPLFMDKVVSMRQLTGERLKGINTQGKIHAKIVVGADGKVWFASKQAHESFENRPEYAEEPDGYPGGHLCYFDPKTGFSRSVGILKKQEGLMGGVIDDARGKLYYRSEPGNHFLEYDIKTGEVRERGHVGSACRYSAIDKNGAVYTMGRGMVLSRYDPQTGYVEDLAIKVEGPGGILAPYVLALGPNGKLYGAAAGHPSVMEFDIDTFKPGPFPEVVMRNVAPAAPPGRPVHDIHAGVFGKDGKFYFPLNTAGPLEKGGKPQNQLRLMRFDPATRKTETVGIPHVVGLDEARARPTFARDDKYTLDHMQGAAVAADGTLFLMDIYPQLNVACFPKLTAPK